MADRTPTNQLEGLALCNTVAKWMKWEEVFSRFVDGSTEWMTPDGETRFVCRDERDELAFRPDIDWNHLAEVMAEIESREEWVWGYVSADREAFVSNEADCFYGSGLFNVAFLRAFVAASEAEREAGS